MKTLILGLGNPILGDDSIGWKVVERVKDISNHQGEIPQPEITETRNIFEYECYSLGGIGLMENLIGYDRVWIIDSIHTSTCPVGTIVCKKLEEFQNIPSGHLTSAHDMSLQTALELGRSIGADLPKEIKVIGIESNLCFDFTEELSEPLKNAFPEVVKYLLNMIDEAGTNDDS
jgi:hydrogenase maturation protease